jgi:hypothetical protein
MDLSNDTRNQHFLPQVEQRLNASNPNAAPSKQRIYSFEVVDREAHSIRLESPAGRLIARNLSFMDLFTFDVSPDETERLNFESLFQRYEHDVASTTEALLRKLAAGDADVGGEIVGLFTAKLLNFTRNPFSVTKVLNTFGLLANYEPTSPVKKQMFERILNGRKPQQARLCKQFGISDSDYARWLRMLFMLFMEYSEADLTMLDGTVKALFESRNHAIAALVCSYSEANCLLSDRSFSTNIAQKGADGFDFNLQSKAFIRYLFMDVHGLAPVGAPRLLVENYKKLKWPVNLTHLVDRLDLLRAFNRNVIYQCHSRVYCSAKDKILL